MGGLNAQVTVENLLADADVRIGNDRPWDIEVHNPLFFPRLLAGGSVALGESYMDGWWDCESLDRFFDRMLTAGLDNKAKKQSQVIIAAVLSRLFNAQKKSHAFIIGEAHYDIGNDLYKAMLDRRMVYSCAYWKDKDNLDGAQEAKLDLICRKLELEPGMRVLDIGCGWGGLAHFAAENYGVEVMGTTVSVEQERYICENCWNLPVKILLQDYRDLDEKFDRIVSVGMFEHVGYRNYRTFMEVVHRSLNPDGIFLLHTIGGNTSVRGTDPWINKYIFPNSMLPSSSQITKSAESLFVLRDWHSFGYHYDRTLMSWYENFRKNWETLKDKYGERFYRMWVYYLLSCAGFFRSGRNQLWQIVFTKNGSKLEYNSIR